MSDSSASAAIAVLRDFYPRQDFPDRTVAAYAQLLARVDGDELLAATKRVIARSPFLPSVSELLREVAEAQLELPDASVAWEIAERGSLKEAPAEIRAAVDSCGGRWSILHSENPGTVRAQFVADYRERRERSVLEAMGAAPSRLTSLPARRMAELPETTRIKPRPVVARAVKRMTGRKLDPPSEEEKRDAILVLREVTTYDNPLDDPLQREAEMIFAEGAA